MVLVLPTGLDDLTGQLLSLLKQLNKSIGKQLKVQHWSGLLLSPALISALCIAQCTS